MAVPGAEQQYNSHSLFVSPDHLMLHSELNNPPRGENLSQATYTGKQIPSTHHQTVWASQRSQEQRPTLPLHSSSLSEWAIPTLDSFRDHLPPTPISPFRPLRPLSEEERLAFPCTGSYTDCWNTSLCPKHRQDVKHEQPPPLAVTAPVSIQQGRPGSSARRRSAPAGDVEPAPPTKMMRNATDPEDAEPDVVYRHQHHHHHQHTSTMSREARLSISKAGGRVPHNLVERRYRDNLNNQIEALRLTLPSLRDALPCSAVDLDDTSSQRMPSKAVIISTAATYIKDMENERARLQAANKALQEQVSSLQKLIRRSDDCDVLQYLAAFQLNNHHAVHLPTPS